MKTQRGIVEYSSVMKRAGQEGWLADLCAAHATPCTRTQAERILHRLTEVPADARLLWTNKRGKARYSVTKRRYGMSLPERPGTNFAYLRVGLVLHEAAHIHDHLVRKKFGHGPAFCQALQELLKTDWRAFVPSVKEIYRRHRGPFSLALTREVVEGKKRVQTSDFLNGPFSAEDAHEEARTMVNDPKDNIIDIYIFSKTEGQFTGAIYRRGETHPAWHLLEEPDGGLELPDPSDEAALLPRGRQEPVRPVDAPDDERVPQGAVPADRPVRNVPAKAPAQPRTPPAPKPRVGLELDPDKTTDWPKSAGAQAVLAHFVNGVKRATSAEICEALGPRLTEMGVAFPASLVSRLKQAGLLRPAAEE